MKKLALFGIGLGLGCLITGLRFVEFMFKMEEANNPKFKRPQTYTEGRRASKVLAWKYKF